MSPKDWFRPPRHLIALFLLVTLIPSVLLVAFGWQLLEQDRELERQQADRRREQAADLVVATLEQALASSEQRLPLRDEQSVVQVTHDSVLLEITDDALEVFPIDRLLYLPVLTPPPSEAPRHLFERGEHVEFIEQDPPRAARLFLSLSASDDPLIRSGALIRAARNLRKSGDAGAALDAYATASRIPGPYIGDVPADLLARAARCALLEEMNRATEMHEDARELHRLLLSGRWRVTRAVFDLHLSQTVRWIGAGAATASPLSLALAEAVQQLWVHRSVRGELPDRSLIAANGTQFVALSRTDARQVRLLLAGPEYVERQWLPKVRQIEKRDLVRVELRDRAGRVQRDGLTHRSAGETGLPWSVAVRSEADVPTGGPRRRTLWQAGLAILAALVLGSTYLVGRAVSRELAVARLQSDFVAAVSHEFRTPLTSLRQLSEMLMDRPETPPDRRLSYYAALQRQTERLHRLVESLLDFGRMEAGTSPFRLAPRDASELVTAVVNEFRTDPAARAHKVRLQAADSATISVDGDALANALWNLLDNAAKYSPPDCDISVCLTRRGDFIEISVEDSGMGVPGAEQRQIFNKFVRGSQAKADGIRGTGLGLALVRHIVEGHQGSVSIKSEVAAGSTFTIRLPARDHPDAAGSAACRAS